ncbi:hypothetical protein L1F30_01670 [Simiduia sp. 21SJ11W-1]|uniref:tetratricopeptide repeat protein n=1 Tax=Simiduia sp. 21SJ11W-1 TaxID=2909669 RepID=UPI00209E540A|nr:hypothetical protein [Simiduia sp. 21SJ11W-1]UTA48262.1 hypothetical protein L1F30_01670 [Simiduia sp. 21SJ11W-1]
MRIIFTVLMLCITASFAFANEWISPIDKKYKAKNIELYNNFDRARALLDSWRGQGQRLDEAGNILQHILEKDSNYAPAYRELGRLYIMAGHINYDNFERGSLPPSEFAILKSIEIEPEYADSYVLLGHLYTQMKRYKDAENSLKKAEAIGTEIPWLHLNWAGLLEQYGRYQEAMQRYQYVVEKGTNNRKAYASALAGITTMYRKMRQYDKANESFKKEIEYEPDNAWSWGDYSSFLLFTYNDVDGAIKNGREAINIMNYGMGRFTLGCALYTKWAMLKDNPATALLAQQYFDEARAIYPYPEKVIEKTSGYKYTFITAKELQKWLTSQSARTQ